MNKFWKALFILQNISFNMSNVCHPQIVGYTEVLDKIFEIYQRCLSKKIQKKWTN